MSRSSTRGASLARRAWTASDAVKGVKSKTEGFVKASRSACFASDAASDSEAEAGEIVSSALSRYL